MQIVIEIPEEAYELLKNKGVDWLGAEHILNAVANGIPLPKGHGRLIDADAVNKKMEEREEKLQDDRSMWESSAVSTALDMFADTIIEADKESEDKEPEE